MCVFQLELEQNVTTDGLANFPQLTQLKEFHFWVRDSQASNIYGEYEGTVRINQQIYSWCAENIPSLKLLGAETEISADYNFALLDITPNMTGSSQLEYLHTHHRLPQANMPNLQHLYFRGPMSEPEDFVLKISNYKNLTDLTLDAPDIYSVLELVGTQLTRFCFGSGSNFHVDYFKIFFLCPNLKQFIQCSGSQFVENSMCKALVKKPLNLEEFSPNFNRMVAPKGFLQMVFEAPFLETIHLRGLIMQQEECLFVNKCDKIFPNLKFLVFDDMQLADDCDMADFVLMMKTFICSAPDLSYVCVRWRWDTEYFNEWKKHDDVNKFLHLVNLNSTMEHALVVF